MSHLFESLGYIGTFVVAIAYIPQIVHLIKEHCAYGISLKAWMLWLVAGLLMFPNALLSKSMIFVVLLIVQIILGGFILIFSYFHRGENGVCPTHKAGSRI